MNISSVIGGRTGPISASQSSAVTPKVELTASLSPITPKIPNSTVSISGQALLQQRVFCGREPLYLSKPPGNMSWAMYPIPVDFLTKQDCELLSQVYEFAQNSGADLGFVDNLGSNLADYRSNNNGRIMSPHNRGRMFDGEGHKVSYTFTDKDAATVKRILASDAIKTTQLDLGFIRFQTNVDYGALSYNNFEFMEQVIDKFSAKGADVPPLDARFLRYEYGKQTCVTHLSKERYEFGPNGPVRKGTAAANANDPLGTLNKKKNSLKTKTTAPETVQDMFRRIMAKAWGSGFGIRIRSLAEFLMNSGR